MADETTPLTDSERAELEQLRAEKAAREQERQAREERAELEQLRAERHRLQESDAAGQRRMEDERIREARERGKKLMEPDDDLSMPLGQKIVLSVMAIAVIVIVATIVFGPK